jgi:antitoxin component YwqK of YwqJK toxin-antitoxin module
MNKKIIIGLIFLASIMFGLIIIDRHEIAPIKNEIVLRNDGLLYKSGSKITFTGRVIDTVQRKIMEYDVVNGIKNGEFILYYQNGNVEMYGHIIDNNYTGKWYYFYPDGQLESEGYFKDDKAYLMWKWYYKNGSLKEEGIYVNGMKEGKWESYNPNGSLKTKIIYRKDEILNQIDFENTKSS